MAATSQRGANDWYISCGNSCIQCPLKPIKDLHKNTFKSIVIGLSALVLAQACKTQKSSVKAAGGNGGSSSDVAFVALDGGSSGGATSNSGSYTSSNKDGSIKAKGTYTKSDSSITLTDDSTKATLTKTLPSDIDVSPFLDASTATATDAYT